MVLVDKQRGSNVRRDRRNIDMCDGRERIGGASVLKMGYLLKVDTNLCALPLGSAYCENSCILHNHMLKQRHTLKQLHVKNKVCSTCSPRPSNIRYSRSSNTSDANAAHMTSSGPRNYCQKNTDDENDVVWDRVTCPWCSHSKKCFLFSHSVTSQTEGLKDNSVRIGPIDTIYETNSTKGKSFTQNCFPMIVNTKTTLQYVMKIVDEGINYVEIPGVCVK